MQRDPRSFLWDAPRAVGLIEQFAQSRTWGEYQRDPMLRSAIERQLEVVGEALNQLSKTDSDLAESIDDLPRIVAFRNVLIHAYATIDDAIVWEVVTQRLDPLRWQLTELLAEEGE